MTCKRFLALYLGFFSLQLCAFIPPVTSMLTQVTQGRVPGRPIEFSGRHQVQVDSDSRVEIEERCLHEKGRVTCHWRFPSFNETTGGIAQGAGYLLNGDKALTTRSGLRLRILFASSAEELKERLIQEQFLRREQLVQFKPSYYPSGDPNTWDTKSGYVRHPDIFMTRSRGNVAYTVEGFREGAVARSFSIDEKLRSIIRLEWKEGDTVSAWTYEAITGDERNGFYPKRMGLEVSTTDKIRTEVFKVGPASERQLADFKNLVRGAKQAADLPDKAFEALRVLLNFG